MDADRRRWAERLNAQTFAVAGQAVRETRRARGFTQAELARDAHVSTRQVAEVERGHARWMSPRVAARLAAALGVSAGELRDPHALDPGDMFTGRRVSMKLTRVNGRALRFARVRRHIRRRTLARQLGLPEELIVRAERGESVEEFTLDRITAAVGITTTPRPRGA